MAIDIIEKKRSWAYALLSEINQIRKNLCNSVVPPPPAVDAKPIRHNQNAHHDTSWRTWSVTKNMKTQYHDKFGPIVSDYVRLYLIDANCYQIL